MSTPTLFRWDDIPNEPMSPTIHRQYMNSASVTLARIELKKGCVVARHTHPNEQLAWIMSGALAFTLGEEGATEERIVRAGEVLVIPPNIPHSAVALEDTVDIDIFSPRRQDWIDGADAYLRGK